MMILDGDEGIIPIETLNVIRSQVLGDILKDIIPIYDSENKIIIGIKFVFEDDFKTVNYPGLKAGVVDYVHFFQRLKRRKPKNDPNS